MPNIKARFEEFNVGGYEPPEGAIKTVIKYWESTCSYNYYLGGCEPLLHGILSISADKIRSYDSRVEFNASNVAWAYKSIATDYPIYKDNCNTNRPLSYGVYIWKRIG